MGVFEMDRFSEGTRVVAQAIADREGVTTVVGGGSTAEAVEALGLMDKMTHVSTGGGRVAGVPGRKGTAGHRRAARSLARLGP